ncbi:MAG: hypothetical protein AAF628_25130 [Planctomycetota bacterium]
MSALAAVAPSQGCTAGAPTQLGVVVVEAAGRPGHPSLPGSRVDIVRVECAGLPTLRAGVLIADPPAGTPRRGTVVLGTGAKGTAAFSSEPLGLPLVTSLLDAGFRIVDRAWQPGWFSSGGSVRKQSCRYATLLQWVFDEHHDGGAFGAVGSSAGSSEVAYALTTWNGADLLDVAVLLGGPPAARLDLQCPNPPAATWSAQCLQLFPAHGFTCGPPTCTGQGRQGLCTSCSAPATPAELRDDSVLHLAARLDFPSTRVHQILGGQDCTNAIPSALLFYAAVTSEKVTEVVPGTPHFVPGTTAGRDAIRRALLGAAACRGVPATMAHTGWPRLGGTLTFDLHGPPGAPFFVVEDGTAAELPVGSLGWLFVAPTFLPLGGGLLDAQTGRGCLSLTVPARPALTGSELYSQALVGRCLSNLVRFEVVP